ncbi:hypothetical protein HCU01_31740 [Halomonas cupida]|uniref:Preprotein translocase subunit SecD n=1 Tax=Halomonas cupida TaxID=44933 RepID=A0A1M7LE06_9GAMM|nr:hypothetical protein [Halomonas cupida]GEN25225.1 hypothetical protein HCU01_31740 [Halomonas cupida]SHM75846.1 hypothetical protein SAMN05660971_03803 [Halomonas cupida]
MQAEDMLPGGQDQVERDGVVIRKGTVGAFLVNARLWCDPATSALLRQDAEHDIINSLPALRALGLFDVLAIRDSALRKLVEAAVE